MGHKRVSCLHISYKLFSKEEFVSAKIIGNILLLIC